MKASHADILAIKLSEKILSTDPKSIIHQSKSGAEAANDVADFICTVSSRFKDELDGLVYPAIRSKSQ